MAITADLISFNQRVSFKTLSPSDSTIIKGTIRGLRIDVETAQNLTDVLTMNENCRQGDPSIPTDLEQLYFFELKTVTDDGSVNRNAYALEWIDPKSFVNIAGTNIYNVNIYDTQNQGVSAAIAVLRQNGFDCAYVSTTTSSTPS